jgi:hypothetical protein
MYHVYSWLCSDSSFYFPCVFCVSTASMLKQRNYLLGFLLPERSWCIPLAHTTVECVYQQCPVVTMDVVGCYPPNSLNEPVIRKLVPSPISQDFTIKGETLTHHSKTNSSPKWEFVHVNTCLEQVFSHFDIVANENANKGCRVGMLNPVYYLSIYIYIYIGNGHANGSSLWVCVEIAGLTCSHWLINVQQECSLTQPQSPMRQVRLPQPAIIHTPHLA